MTGTWRKVRKSSSTSSAARPRMPTWRWPRWSGTAWPRRTGPSRCCPRRVRPRASVGGHQGAPQEERMEPLAEDWDRGVAVAAHPDDLEYGTASAVARWTGQGRQVSYLLVTRGEAGIAGRAPAEVGPLRAEEERRGAAAVGVSDVEFLDHADGVVEYGVPLRRDLAAAFRRLRPQVVFTMSFDLTWGEWGPVNHCDHRAVGLAVLDA